MAEQLLTAGHSLLCISRSTSESLEVRAAAQGCSLEQWSMDLENATGAASRLKAWLESLKPESFAHATLINNAGVIPRIAPLSMSDPVELSRALRVGLEAPLLLTAAFLGVTQQWNIPRKVLNISSGLGRRAMASQAAYCAAKAGMDHFTRCLALDEALKPHGAKVCSLAPGVIDTDMQELLRDADAASFPDRMNFLHLKEQGLLTPPAAAAAQVLAYLDQPDFGLRSIGDVRD